MLVPVVVAARDSNAPLSGLPSVTVMPVSWVLSLSVMVASLSAMVTGPPFSTKALLLSGPVAPVLLLASRSTTGGAGGVYVTFSTGRCETLEASELAMVQSSAAELPVAIRKP